MGYLSGKEALQREFPLTHLLDAAGIYAVAVIVNVVIVNNRYCDLDSATNA